jgi:hypothetical protein
MGFKLDNAKANLAEDVRHALADFIGCFIDAGPARSPDDRPYIERFFGTIASSLSSRLPGYTGSNLRDVRRALSDPKSNLRLSASLDELEELLEAAIGGYNATPHAGLNGRTPLEAMEHSVRVRGAIGSLVRLLTDHQFDQLDVHALYPSHRSLSAKVRVIDISQHLGQRTRACAWDKPIANA